jgi:hypothetical protein
MPTHNSFTNSLLRQFTHYPPGNGLKFEYRDQDFTRNRFNTSILTNIKMIIMRNFLILLLFAGVLPASAQVYVNKVDVTYSPVQYIELWEKFNKGNEKLFAMIDYGQQDDLSDEEGRSLVVTNKNGQYLEFNSMVDVLNYMYRNGWEVMHPKTTGDIQSYIMRKRENYVGQTSTAGSTKKRSAADLPH